MNKIVSLIYEIIAQYYKLLSPNNQKTHNYEESVIFIINLFPRGQKYFSGYKQLNLVIPLQNVCASVKQQIDKSFQKTI